MIRDPAIVSLAVCAGCAVLLVIALWRRPQRMKIMNAVWPITTLYAGPLALLAYVKIGTNGSRDEKPPLWKAALKGGMHCGAGCTIGDIIGEFVVYFAGLAIAGQIIWAYLVADLVFAWLIGIVFQYFTIAPMRHLSPGQGIIAAIKADTASIAGFQLGMYAWMIFARFVLIGRDIPPTHPAHWLSMQAAMLIGLVTTWPVNALLIRGGLKERM